MNLNNKILVYATVLVQFGRVFVSAIFMS